MSINFIDDFYYFKCPHCDMLSMVLVKEINCAIFRHGSYVKTLLPIDPHTPKEICEQLVAKNLIFGCGKPFKLIKNSRTGNWNAIVCGYI